MGCRECSAQSICHSEVMELHVREWGHGDRVAVLLPGMMGSSDSWWRVAPTLADRGYHVLAIDLPGHGLSPKETLTPPLKEPRVRSWQRPHHGAGQLLAWQ